MTGDNRRILVLGASGRIGMAMALHYAEKNTVFGIARFKNPETERTLQAKGVRTIRKDLSDPGPGLLDGIPPDMDLVVNQAVLWKADPPEAWRRVYEVNAFAGPRILQHCLPRVKAHVFGSTGGIYGGSPQPKSEEDEPIAGDGIYHCSKFAGEMCAEISARLLNVPTAILRYYYPSVATKGVVFAHARYALFDVERPVHKDDTYGYVPTWIDDVVAATAKAVDVAAVPAVTINVAGSEYLTQRQMLERSAKALGKTARIRETPEPREGYRADISKMTRLLGAPKVSYDEMLRRVIESFRTTPPDPPPGNGGRS